MPIPPARILLAVLAASLALPIAGCGDDKKGGPIPPAQATELKNLLTQTQQRMDARNACGDVHDQNLPQLEATVNRLPGSVDHDTRKTLKDGVRHLRTLVNEECNQIRADKLKTQTTDTNTTPTTPTETQQTETQQTQTQQTQTNTTPTTPTDTGNNGGATVPSPNGGGAKPGKAPKSPKD